MTLRRAFMRDGVKMAMVQKALGIFFVFVLAPCCIGPLFTTGMKRDGRGLSRLYLAGFLAQLAVFQLIAVPVMILDAFGMDRLVYLTNGALLLLMAAGVCRAACRLRREGLSLTGASGRLANRVRQIRLPGRTCCVFWGIALLLIGFQMVMSYLYASFDGDDAYYVVQSVLADETGVLNRIRPYTGLSTDLDIRHALASLPLWIAYVARMTGIHAAIVAHTLLPLVLIPLTYTAYFLIGRRLFGAGDKRVPLFLALAGLMQIWGNTSIYTNATFFLMRTWQGKSILANLVLLGVFWLLLEILGEEKKKPVWGFWALLVTANVVSAMMTSMGTFLAALLIGIVGLTAAVRQKRATLLIRLGLCCLPNLAYLLLLLILS